MLISYRNSIEIVLFWLVLIEDVMLSKYILVTWFVDVNHSSTWFKINVELVYTVITSTLTFMANSSQAIKASHYALLFEALNPNIKDCSIHSLFKLFYKILALDHFSLYKPSTYRFNGSMELAYFCFESYCSKGLSSAIKSART